MMESDDDIGTRIAAAYAVFRIMGEDRPALDLLIEIAGQSGRNLGGASIAVRFLGALGPKANRALPVLTRSCRFKSAEELGFDALLRTKALMAVAAVGGVDLLPALREALKSADAFDRKAAANAISLIGAEAGITVPDLIQAVQDNRGALSWRARGAATKALGDIGPDAEAAIPTLERMAAASYEPWEAWFADAVKESLNKIGGSEERSSPDSGRK